MLQLSVYDTTGNLIADWSHIAKGLQFSSNEHGFESLSVVIPMNLTAAFFFYNDAKIKRIQVHNGACKVWEGRIEDVAISNEGLKITALGYWSALSDIPYTAIWSTKNLAYWRPTQNTDFASSAPDKYELGDEQNRLKLVPKKGELFGNANNSVGGLVFQGPESSQRQLNLVQFSYDFNGLTNWRFELYSSNTARSVVTLLFGLTSAGALQQGAQHINFTANDELVFLLYYNVGVAAAYAGETGALYLRIANLRIASTTTNRVNTSLTAIRAAGANVTATVGSTTGMYVGMQLVVGGGGATNEIITVLSIGSSTQFNATFINAYASGQLVQGIVVYPDEIVGHIVSAVNGINNTQISSSTALIQSPAIDVTEQVFEDEYGADILTKLATLGDNQTTPRRWEVGVYENQMLFYRYRGYNARTWYVDITDLELERTVSTLYNSVYAKYQSENNRDLRSSVSADSTSISKYGLTRREKVDVQTTSSVQAGIIRDTELADKKNITPRADIEFDRIYDKSGVIWPSYMVRSGDTIVIRNLPVTLSTDIDKIRTFRISRTQFNVDDRKLTVEPELPLPRLDVLLARQNEGL